VEAVVKRWQRVAGLAQAVRMIEKRLARAERDGRDAVLLVALVQRLRARLARERLAWEGVKGA
jgi:hypothetical protein